MPEPVPAGYDVRHPGIGYGGLGGSEDRHHNWRGGSAPLDGRVAGANMALVVTGGLVRLTKSGLGCPTWPQCEGASYVPRSESGIHGLIEFGNRTLTFVLAAVAIGTFVAAWRARGADGEPRQDLRRLAFLAGLLIRQAASAA
jgi:hypothetical protein